MINNYTNQTLTLKRPSTPNEYNESTYTSTKIKGRKEDGYKLIRNKYGEEVVSSARVFTKTSVETDDLIDDRLVISSEPLSDIDGATGFYTVYLK
jgi:hypothetical protein